MEKSCVGVVYEVTKGTAWSAKAAPDSGRDGAEHVRSITEGLGQGWWLLSAGAEKC